MYKQTGESLNMSSTPDNKIVTVTYQSIILTQLKMLMAAHSYNDVETTWQVAKATYPALPPEVKTDPEVKQQYTNIINGLYNLKQNCKTIDKNLTRRILIRKRREFLLNSLDIFIDKIHESMAKNNWYVQDHTIKAKNEGIKEF